MEIRRNCNAITKSVAITSTDLRDFLKIHLAISVKVYFFIYCITSSAYDTLRLQISDMEVKCIMHDIKNISLRDIIPNPLNKSRSMDYNEIENLKDSIQEVGLLHPLVVYRNDAGTYTLISGHRRFAALNNMAGADYEVPCVVIERPANDIEEAEYMTRANVHRSSPDEIRNEVKIANDLWNSMSKDKKKVWSARLEEEFIEKNYANPTYREDPKQFKSNRFRPRLMYINKITGLNLSNRSISGYLTSTLEEEGEAIISEKPERKPNKVTVKKIAKTMTKLNELLDEYAYREDSGKPNYISELQETLAASIEKISKMTDKDL